MFTLVAWSKSQAGTTTYQNIAAVPDSHLTIKDNYVYISKLSKLIGVYLAGGSEAVAAYLASPSLRKLAYYDLPLIQTNIEPSGGESVRLFPTTPLSLEEGEGLEILLKSSSTATVVMSGVAFLADAPLVEVGGEISTFLATVATATTNTVASVWTAVSLSFRQTLPVGRYQVVGAKLISAKAVAFRFIPVGESHRPGGIVCADIGAKVADVQRNGKMGVWFEFDSQTPPSIEILANAADTADLTLYLDMIKIS